MAKAELEKFLEELNMNKQAMEAIAKKKPETLEALAEITGGFAKEQGYRFSDEEILAYYDDRLRQIRLRTDSATKLVDKEMESVTGGTLLESPSMEDLEYLTCANPTMEIGPIKCSNRQDALANTGSSYKCKNRQDGIVK